MPFSVLLLYSLGDGESQNKVLCIYISIVESLRALELLLIKATTGKCYTYMYIYS